MTPWLDDGDVRLYHGDVRAVLAGLPDQSVDCVVTSPPYWGLRDYGTGQWDGGNPDCDHIRTVLHASRDSDRPKGWDGNFRNTSDPRPIGYADVCGKCGATRIDEQLGLEPTPDLFVTNMVAVFREVRRVLADHGTCWVNLGDSYFTQGGRGEARMEELGRPSPGAITPAAARGSASGTKNGGKPKDLVGIPWRVAFALQADGWWLRSDIIWAKPNPMPESVTDRPTKAHEYVFLLTKQPRYWFDAEAVREPSTSPEQEAHNQRYAKVYDAHSENVANGAKQPGNVGSIGIHARPGPGGRNVRTVWNIATQPYPEAHFATFPEELARRCILAGCPTRVCRVCGKPSERIVERESVSRPDLPRDHPEWRPSRYDNGKAGDPQAPGPGQRFQNTETVGWSDCGHNNWRPGLVLDPFAGSGTTLKVARDHGRHSIGIDLSSDYLELAARRLQQLSLLTAPAEDGGPHRKETETSAS